MKSQTIRNVRASAAIKLPGKELKKVEIASNDDEAVMMFWRHFRSFRIQTSAQEQDRQDDPANPALEDPNFSIKNVFVRTSRHSSCQKTALKCSESYISGYRAESRSTEKSEEGGIINSPTWLLFGKSRRAMMKFLDILIFGAVASAQNINGGGSSNFTNVGTNMTSNATYSNPIMTLNVGDP